MNGDVPGLRVYRDVMLAMSDRHFTRRESEGRQGDRHENWHELTPSAVGAG